MFSSLNYSAFLLILDNYLQRWWVCISKQLPSC